MKNLLLTIALTLFTLNASANVLDLRSEGYTGRYCVGDTLSYNLDGEFVEKILVSAEGISRDGFIKVYADGNLIHNIGVPGYDPDYTFRVRQSVSNITLKFEETCSRILDMKIFTEGHTSQRDSHSFRGYGVEGWGADVQSIVSEMVQRSLLSGDNLWNNFLKPLQVLAIKYDAVAAVSGEGDIKTAVYALKLAKVIADKEDELLDSSSRRQDMRNVRDLMQIKEDILEAYDVKSRNLEAEIEELSVYL